MRLDPRDLLQAEQSAAAELNAAAAAVDSSESELSRSQALQRQSFISAQAVDRVELIRREALARQDAAAARLEQARNAKSYSALVSPASGVLLDVSGEPGQVVAAGQPVAVLAQGAGREIEVFLPDGVSAPQRGSVVLAGDLQLPLVLRELAGAVDPQGRTRRARYSVTEGAEELVLGSVVSVRLSWPAGKLEDTAWRVPIGALDERGSGARLWRVDQGRAAPVPVQVLGIDGDVARVKGSVTAGQRVVAVGTHLLSTGMAVRELSP